MILVADERERLDASSRKSGWPQASTADHVSEADECGDYNDCSYVLLYRTNGYRILFAGSQQDARGKSVLHVLATTRSKRPRRFPPWLIRSNIFIASI